MRKIKLYRNIALVVVIAFSITSVLLINSNLFIHRDQETMQTDHGNSKLVGGLVLDEKFIDQLKKEGFSEQDITQAASLISKVTSELKDIMLQNSQTANSNVPNTADNGLDNSAEYDKLFEKINPPFCLSLMLKLKENFGTYERTLDEYLLSLQLGLDLEDYSKDKRAYEESKGQKISLLDASTLITSESISNKYLAILQALTAPNTSPTDESVENPDKTRANQGDQGVNTGEAFDNISPKVIDPRPTVPTADVPGQSKSSSGLPGMQN